MEAVSLSGGRDDELLKAWAAGFFDGEGCVIIVQQSTGTMRLGVDVSQASRAPLDALIDRWGGKINLDPRPRGNRQPAHKWRAHGREAIAFLRDVYPFLLVKGPAAEVAFAYEATIVDRKGRKKGALTPDVMAYREELRGRLRVINRRGRDAA